MERRWFGVAGIAFVIGLVAVAMAWLVLPRDRTARGDVHVSSARPTGVLLWLHDGIDTWPPRITAHWADGSRAPARVDLPELELATDWDWSPDLSRLLWLEQVDPREPQRRLVVGGSDGSSPAVVTQLDAFGSYRGRAWSPDSSRVAYAASTAAGTGLWVVDARTGTRRSIHTWSEDVDVDVDWSAGGTRIAVAVSGGSGAGVHTMDPDGTDVRTVSSLDAYRVRWSPTAPMLLLEATGPDDLVPGIWIVGADGTGARRLSPFGVAEAGPVWSPDGVWIAFTSQRDRETAGDDSLPDPRLIGSATYLMRTDGSDVRLLVPPRDRGWSEAWDWFASWPPRSA